MQRTIRVGSFCLALLSCVLLVPGALRAEATGSHSARSIITSNLQGSKLTALKAPPLPIPAGAVDQGRVDSEKLLGLRLVMKRSPEQEAALYKFITQTRTPGNPLYAQTLTPKEFVETFGLSQHDVTALKNWIDSQGFVRVKVQSQKDTISFMGTAGQIEDAFGIELHSYRLASGRVAFANVGAPKIPAAMAPAVRSIEGLENIFNEQYISNAPIYAPRQGKTPSADATAVKPAHDLNPGWTANPVGESQLWNMRQGQSLLAMPDLYQPTNMDVTVTPITGTNPTFANGQTSTVTATLTWTAAGTPTGTVTFYDSDEALDVTTNLTTCTKTNATTYTCTYAWTAASGGFQVPDLVTAYYGGDATYGVGTGDATLSVTLTGEFDETYDLTSNLYTWPEGTSPAVGLTFDLEQGFLDPPTGNVMLWGTPLVDQITEFTKIQNVCDNDLSFLGLVICSDTWNPVPTLPAGTYTVYASYSGDGAAESNSESSLAIADSEFIITATGTTTTATMVTAAPATVRPGGGTTFTTTTTWAGAGAQPTGSVSIAQTGAFSGFGGAIFPTASATTSSGAGSYHYGQYTYQYSCITSTANKNVICQITDSDVADLLENQPGANTLKAEYAGDTTYKSSSGNVTVTYTTGNDYSSTTTLAANTTTPSPGDTVAYTVTIKGGAADKGAGSPVPTGTVTLASQAINNSPITDTLTTGECVASGTGATQTYTCTVNQNGVVPAALRANTYTVTATYSGDANYAGSNASLTLNVSGTIVTTSAVSANPTTVSGVTPSTTVTDVISWSPSQTVNPSGTVALSCASGSAGTCTNLPAPVSLNSSSCTQPGAGATSLTCTIPYALHTYDSALGSYNLKMTYSGDDNYKASSGVAVVTDTEVGTDTSTTTVAANPTSVVYGAGTTVTYTASVVGSAGNGQPTGTVTFSGNPYPIGPTSLSGTITAGNCSKASRVYTCTVTASGAVAVATPANAAGYTVTATYNGDATFEESSGTTKLPVTVATPTVTVQSITDYYGDTVTLQAVETGKTGAADPTGVPTFKVNGVTVTGTPSCTPGTVPTVNQVCSISYQLPATLLGGMNYTISVTFAADTNYATATGTGTLTLDANATATAVSATPNAISGAGTTTLTATVTNTSVPTGGAVPTGGTVTFTDTTNAATLGSCTLSAGTCSATNVSGALFAAGANTVKASYGGVTGEFLASSGTTTLTIGADTTTTAVVANPNSINGTQTSTVTATVTDTTTPGTKPTGTVTFTDTTNNAALGSCMLSTGSCSVMVPGTSLAAGANTIKASYGGVANDFTASSGTTTLTLAADATSTSVVANPNSINGAQTSTVTATVSDTTVPASTPSGTVTFTDTTNNAALGSCMLSTGSCSVMVPGTSLASGANTIQASYAGVANSFTASSGTTTLTLSGPPPCSGNALCFTSVSHNFGQVQVGTAASAYGIQITNNSTTTAYPFSLNFTPANGFTKATNCPAMIAAGGKCELEFYFTPAVKGPVSATWSLVTEGGFTYTPSNGGLLQGSGTGQSGVSVTTNGHNFGTVTLGQTSTTYGTELSNSTTTAESITLGPVPSGPFTMMTNCGTTLAAGSSCEIQFTFTPTSTSNVSVVVPLSGTPATITSGGVNLPNGGITLSGN